MARKEFFYQCSLRSLMQCYYDCKAWIPVLEDALRDEEAHDPKITHLYGLDNCDLAPFLAKERSDEIYRLSRHDMVKALTEAQWGRPIVVVPPATVIEYIHGALISAGKIRKYLEEFDSFVRSGAQQNFGELLWRVYEKMLSVLEGGPDVPGLATLKDLLQSGKVQTFEQAIRSRDLLDRITSSETAVDQKGYELLSSRRSERQDSELSCLIDVANFDLFLAAKTVLEPKGFVPVMTTTGNLTLEAYRKASPALKPQERPCRHLATPYIRVVLRQEEAGQHARIAKIKMGMLALEEIIAEIADVPDAESVSRGQVEGLNPNQRVGTSKRLYDATRAWLDLFYFPYLRGLREVEQPAGETLRKGQDVDFAVNWVRTKRADLESRAQVSQKVKEDLAKLGGFDSEDFVERFVPDHPEAKRIISWLQE